MDVNNIECYVASLQQHIHHLQYVLQQWKPYVPKSLIQKTQYTGQPHLSLPSPFSSLQIQQIRQPPSPKSTESEERWRKQLDIFIRKIPDATKWPEVATIPSESPLDTILRKEIPPPEAPTQVTLRQSSHVIQVVEDYALLTNLWLGDAKNRAHIATFMKFLFCAICHVACFVGTNPNDVNTQMGKISKGSATHLDELRHGVVWGFEAIDRLHTEGKWNIRSGDIPFYFPPSLDCLRILAKAKESMHAFTGHMNDDKYTNLRQDTPTLGISVPCIIKCLFGKTVPLTTICTSLRCNVTTARQTFLELYWQPYGSSALDDTEVETICYPLGRPQSTPSNYGSHGFSSDQNSGDENWERPRKRPRHGANRFSGASMPTQHEPSESSPDNGQHPSDRIQLLNSHGQPPPVDQPRGTEITPNSQRPGQDDLEPDPAISRTLFNQFGSDPAISQTLFSRVESDPAIRGALFTQVESDPAIMQTLFSRGLAAL